MSNSELPAAAGKLAASHPKVWEAYQDLGAAVALSGPLSAREKRLIKLALAIAVDSQGATHSHARRAIDEGLSPDEIRQVALLAIPTLGLPSAMKGKTWIDDVVDGMDTSKP